jgi:hypothetical protein
MISSICYFGQAVEAILDDIKRYEVPPVAGIVELVVSIWLVHAYRRRRTDRSAS